MDAGVIAVIVIGVVFIVGGTIISHLSSKANYGNENNENKDKK